MNMVSTVLFGDVDHDELGSMANYYWRSAVVFALSALGLYRGWEIRIHVEAESLQYNPLKPILGWMDSNFPRLHIDHVVGLVDGALCAKMLWRMYPLFNPTVDVLVCRDIDSVVMRRERLAVNHWLAQNADLNLIAHMIRDSPSHSGPPIMGGMCGFKTAAVCDALGWQHFQHMMRHRGRMRMDKHGDDQRLLRYVSNLLGPRVCEHTFAGKPNRVHRQLKIADIGIENEAELFDTNTADAIDTLYDNDPNRRRVGIGQMCCLKMTLESLARHNDQRTLETIEQIRKDPDARAYFAGLLPGD